MSTPEPLGRPRLHLRETSSTNERAKELALAGAPHGTIVTADFQTAGRGRHGRSWTAPPGASLLVSIVVRLSAQSTALLPLATAVAVCEACEEASPVQCTIKWPNDVWIDGRKVAGILLEGRPREGWAVIGIGINVALRTADLPEELRETATSLAEAGGGGGPAPSVEAVLAATTAALERRLTGSPEEVTATWNARDVLLRREVTWDAGEGVAEGIDPYGALVVSLPDGSRTELHAGEVKLVRRSEPDRSGAG
jgi:BirA family transcriptional regulator, biotin operon repressor / biotin---[acetyl-CoA-carboxylase] ligase